MNIFNNLKSFISTPLPNTFISTFTPNISGSGMKLWLDSNNSNSLTISSNLVSNWTDLTGNTNVSAANKPTYNPTGCNGKPTLTFTNGDQFTSESVSVYSSLANFNYFIVVKIPSSPSPVPSPFSLTTPNVLAIYLYARSGLPGSYTVGVPWTYNTSDFRYNSIATPTNTFCIVQLSISSNSQTFYINGVAGTPVTFSFTASTSNTIIIGNSGYNADSFVGSMSEILVYTNSLSTTNRQKIEGYLAWKWGLQSSLPTNHPYSPTITNHGP